MSRVVINGRFLSQPSTGVQRCARETILALDDLLAGEVCRDSFVLAVPPGHSDSIRLGRIKVVELGGFSGHLWEQITLARYASDALLFSFSYSGPILRKRQVITVYDATVAALPKTFSLGYRLIHRAMIAALKNRVSAIMTISEFSRSEIAKHYGIRRPITVGTAGWEHCVPQGPLRNVLGRFGLESRGYLLCVGSLKPNKNLKVVIEALALTRRFDKTIAVVGVSDRRLFKGVDLDDRRILPLGFVEDEALAHLYHHAEWLLMPSLYEGFGLPAVEAYANHCPVLAANAGSLPEVCGDGALYFDPNSAEELATLLDRVTCEPSVRDVVAKRSASQLRRFSWKANAQIVLGAVRDTFYSDTAEESAEAG